MTDLTRRHVDQLVDDGYLADCAYVWVVTSALSRAVLDVLDASLPDAPDEHRAHCISWLRRAAAYRIDHDTSRVRRGQSVGTEAMVPTLALLGYAADQYISFLRGATSGRAVLLAGAGLDLWYDYFESRNALYRPLNGAAVQAVFDLLHEGRGCRILEVGTGTGGATRHLITAWPRDLRGPVELTATDASPRLLLTTRQNIVELAPANVSLDFRRFDFDVAPDQQQLRPQSFDIVFGVNALHNARDLVSTLRGLRSLLRPGGVLLLSESLCAAGDLVHQEFILNLLPLPADAYERTSRFYSRSDWLGHFAAAGVKADVQVNSLGPELVMTATVGTDAPL